jgi:NAD-reducing hydrogenase large subunit
MTQTITIDPVTRLEGHGKITLHLNDAGIVEDAEFSVTQVRGFEKFSEGRPFYEMPSLMARVCGICPVSHLLASAKAGEAIMAVRIPYTATQLRSICNLAQMVQSHALSFFYLSSPDLLLGMDSDPVTRNIFGVVGANPEIGKAGIGLRRFGQTVIELLGTKRIHTGWIVAGGVTDPLTPEKREKMLAMLPEAYANIKEALKWYKSILPTFKREVATFASEPSAFLGMVGPDGKFELTDGTLSLIDAKGADIATGITAADFDTVFGEAVEPYSFTKFAYFKALGYPAGSYRVGPLARLNIARTMGTPLADAELNEFRQLESGPVQGSFHFHQARLVEILYGIEKIEELLGDKEILSPHVRATAGVNSLEGAGISEAPRGTLMHHYKVDNNGLMKWSNLVIATGQNNHAMNRGILQVAKEFVRGNELEQGMLNRVEAVIRTFDPCLSCSTHAYGKMPLAIELRGPGNELLSKISR